MSSQSELPVMVTSNSAPSSTLSSRMTRRPPRLTLSAQPSSSAQGGGAVGRSVTVRVVPFAVHVVGDRTPDRDKLRSRRDPGKPSARGEVTDDLLEAHPRFAREDPARLVEREETIESRRPQHLPSGVDGRVSIASPEPARDRPRRVEPRREL